MQADYQIHAQARFGQKVLTALRCLTALLFLNSTAQAGGFCADMNDLLDRAKGNFSLIADGKVEILLPGADDCGLSHSLSGANAYSCNWGFAYRAQEAQDMFEAFNQSLQDCFGRRMQAVRDQGVNHPDFYDLRLYQVDQITVSVSIKDKGALQRTFVFVRINGPDPN